MTTKAEFKSSFDTIVGIIEACIKRNQPSNAEKYINYLFKVTYECYVQGFVEFDDEAPAEQHDSNPKHTFKSPYIGYLEYKLFHLINLSITPGHNETYKFFHKHFIDLLKNLIANNLNMNANRLLWRYPVVIKNLLTLNDQFNSTERTWFEHSSYEFFEILYPLENLAIDDIDGFIGGLFFQLKIVIDYNKQDVFEEFLHDILSLHPITHVGSTTLHDATNTISDLNLSFQLLRINEDPFTRDDLIRIKNKFKEVLGDDHIDLLVNIDHYLLDRYKYNRLRLVLFSSIMYSFFKRNYEFITIYLQAHQPSDSDASWAGNDFALNYRYLPTLLRLKYSITDPQFISVGHHGFTKYYDQIIGYYLMQANELEDKFKYFFVSDVIQAVNFQSTLRQVKRLNPAYLKEIESRFDVTKEVFEQIIDYYLEFLQQKIDQFNRSSEDSQDNLEL